MPASKSFILVGALVVAVALSLGVRAVQQQNQDILNELSEIRQLVEKTAGDTQVKLARITGPVLGDPDAPLTMVEFSDLQCPYCREFHTTTFEQIKTNYIDKGKLRYVARHFPLDSIHPLAIAAARAAHCAAGDGKFWEMRHTILVNNRKLRSESFVGFAQELKLDVGRFESCVADTARIDAEWQADRADAKSVGVSGTPSFVIGRSSVLGVDGIRLAGAKPYAVFDAKFKELLGRDPRSTG